MKNKTNKICTVCNSTFTTKWSKARFCSKKCETDFKAKEKVNMWLSGTFSGERGHGYGKLSKPIERWLLEQANYSCQMCGFNTLHPRTGNHVLEIHHLDENPYNCSKENLVVLCPNCHALSDSRNPAKGTGRKKYAE